MIKQFSKLLAALTIFCVAGLPASAAGVSLILVEESGCVYCAQWNTEVGLEYPLTPEGRSAPLRRIDLAERLPDGIEFKSKPRITPTFVLVKDGRELSRLEGYPGEDFFWGLLGRMLGEAGIQLE